MKQKNSYKILDIDDNFNFVEEVHENEVEEQQLQDEKKEKKINFQIIIITFLSMLLFGFGLWYAFIRPSSNDIANLEAGDLFIVHSSVDFGKKIKSFLKYDSKANASTYKFYVENKNDVDITYKVRINKKIVESENNIEESLLNYSLIKNDIEIATGNIYNVNRILAQTTISANSKDDYELKIWSISKTKKAYEYEIEIIE